RPAAHHDARLPGAAIHQRVLRPERLGGGVPEQPERAADVRAVPPRRAEVGLRTGAEPALRLPQLRRFAAAMDPARLCRGRRRGGGGGTVSYARARLWLAEVPSRITSTQRITHRIPFSGSSPGSQVRVLIPART